MLFRSLHAADVLLQLCKVLCKTGKAHSNVSGFLSFVAVLAIVIVVSLIGMILLKKKPVILQGQIEATEIRISGKLPGRIDTFLVKEGQNVRQGDTLVVINSPEALAKYQQAST